MSSYHNLTVQKCIQETEETVSVILKVENNKPDSFLPGQFITLLFKEAGKEIKRSYSISSTPDQLPLLRITIKKIHSDSPSSHYVENLKVGSVIKSLPPLGTFTVNPNPDIERKMILFGAGSGITPLFSMLKSVLEIEPKSEVYLFYSNHNEQSIIFRNELDVIAEKFTDRFKLVNVLSKPSENWGGEKGRITKQKALELLSRLNVSSLREYHYYLCGPSGMMKNIMEALDELNIDHKKIHKENFVVELLNENVEIEETERDVTIFIKGEKHIVNVLPGESIQQKALEAGLPIPNSCQHGTCGTCKARLLSGKLKLISQSALSQDDINDGYCLTCVGYPASDNVVVLYEDPFEF